MAVQSCIIVPEQFMKNSRPDRKIRSGKTARHTRTTGRLSRFWVLQVSSSSTSHTICSLQSYLAVKNFVCLLLDFVSHTVHLIWWSRLFSNIVLKNQSKWPHHLYSGTGPQAYFSCIIHGWYHQENP